MLFFILVQLHSLHVPTAGNVIGAFPVPPYDGSMELLPTWAIAVVTAACTVTMFWTVSIILLVCKLLYYTNIVVHYFYHLQIIFEVLGKRRSGNYEVSLTALRTAPSQISLGAPPPPVSAPPRR